jgi:ABC-2 type transport system ATP-binding protein
MSSATPLVEIASLTKYYGARAALREASLTVFPGEIVGLIGPNGSGKTTLCECVAGVMPASAGMVSANGVALSPEARKEILYYVPDRVRPWPAQPVGWVLEFIGGLYGTPDAERQRVIADLALESFLPARLATLSKGEHKRVLVALGLLTSQPLLMLDEPFDGLDFRQTRDVMRVLRSHVTGNGDRPRRALFLSIHQLTDAERICDRLILLSGGEIVGRGTMDELRTAARLPQGSLEEVFLALT